MDFEYKVATSLDHAWLNFELDIPLEPSLDSSPNPFYVERPENPTGRLERELLSDYLRTPMYFLAGYRGSGKSTELLRLTWLPSLRERYWMLHLSATEVADARRLEAVDLLLGLTARLLTAFVEHGYTWPDALVVELEGWCTWLLAQIPWLRSDSHPESSTPAFDLITALPARVRLESVTRVALRQALLPRQDEWTSLLNLMLATVHAHTGRPVLMLVDDLHHISSEGTRAFFDLAAPLRRLICSTVYVISPVAAATMPLASNHVHHLLPLQLNVKGREMLRRVVLRRMSLDLIDPIALDQIVEMSAGSLSELRYLMRQAIGYADLAGQSHVTVKAVGESANRVRRDYQYMLKGEDWRTLVHLLAGRVSEMPMHLLNMGAVLARGAENDAPFAVLPALKSVARRRVEVST